MIGLKVRPQPRGVVPRTEYALVCVIRLAFFFAFIAVHLASRKPVTNPRAAARSTVVAVLSFLVSAAHLGVLVWLGVAEARLPGAIWAYFLAQAVSWVGLGVSLLLKGMRRAARLTACVWWTSVFVLNSVISIRSIVALISGNSEITVYGILALGSWPVCVLLLACAAQGFFTSAREPDELGEADDHLRPLISDRREEKGNVTPLATSGVFTYLGFFWLNPLLALGHSKTLELPDIPDLPPYYGAQKNHEAFTREIKSQQRRGEKISGRDASDGTSP